MTERGRLEKYLSDAKLKAKENCRVPYILQVLIIWGNVADISGLSVTAHRWHPVNLDNAHGAYRRFA